MKQQIGYEWDFTEDPHLDLPRDTLQEADGMHVIYEERSVCEKLLERLQTQVTGKAP
ncbi:MULTISPECIES: hypothetical protein [Gluconobacter]|uniref:Uncharacterized protein n=1 Tax=Gluconobacter cadivus TaxID=2728101 RepID=A0ABR9YUY6_9PROT|nr:MULTISPECIES: hypothetical protein [Gluconobacter]MBF0888340.1 hypothetical protein [Gluconobacter cadivus]MBS1060844.1 hypothetical protein [Gluconobacter sp. Dm-44]